MYESSIAHAGDADQRRQELVELLTWDFERSWADLADPTVTGMEREYARYRHQSAAAELLALGVEVDR